MQQTIYPDVKAVVTRFVYNMWNGQLEPETLRGHDYGQTLHHEPSAAEQAIAIFLNTLRLDDRGLVLNAREAEHRAAQYIRSYLDPSYHVDPPFTSTETERSHYRSSSSGPMP